MPKQLRARAKHTEQVRPGDGVNGGVERRWRGEVAIREASESLSGTNPRGSGFGALSGVPVLVSRRAGEDRDRLSRDRSQPLTVTITPGMKTPTSSLPGTSTSHLSPFRLIIVLSNHCYSG